MCDCDDNPPRVCGRVVRAARKPHRCSECSRAIRRGERYEEHTGLWDHGWETFRWCAHCAAGQAILDREIKDFCFCFAGLWESAFESRDGWWWQPVGGGWEKVRPNLGLARLIAGARRKWTVRRGERCGQLMPMPDASMRLQSPVVEPYRGTVAMAT